MNVKKCINDLINMILASFICFSFIYGKTSSLMFNLDSSWIYLIICGLLVVYFICSWNKYTLIISCSAAFITAVSVSIYLIATQSLSNIIFEITSFISWAMNYIHEITPVNPTYRIYLVGIICVLITLFVFTFVVRKFNFLVLVTYGSAFFILQWYFKYMVGFSAFYLFIFTMLICFFKHIYVKKYLSDFNNYVSPTGLIAWTTPLCAIILVIALVLPSGNGISESKWLDKSLNSMYTFFTNVFNGYKVFEYFSLDSSGFNDSNHRLGGKVHLNKKLVLKVDSPRVTYLKGACKEIYTGYSWENGKKDYVPIILDYGVSNIDIYEMTKGISIFDYNNSDDTSRYFFTDKVTVTYQNLITKSLFIPAKFIKLEISKPSSMKKYLNGTIEQNGIVTSKSVLSRNFKYRMDVYNPKYSSKLFQDLLRNSKKGFYDDLNTKINLINKEIQSSYQYGGNSSTPNSVLDYTYNITDKDLDFIIDYPIDNGKGTIPLPPDLTDKLNDLDGSYTKVKPLVSKIGSISSDDLSKLTSLAHEYNKKYLQIPRSLPKRVKNLAKSITAPYTTNYDKIKAIEKYLSKNYPYTLTPKSTPNGRDFVDYFLFDLKEGYCVYYASAMTMLVRSIGIPARYVEGFVLPAVPNKSGIYDVTNQQAHAWVEVYLEGFGWIPFEPTSPYVSAFYNNDSKNFLSSSFSSNPDYLEYIKGLKAYNDPSGVPQDENMGNSSKSNTLNKGVIALCVILLVLILLASVFVFNHLKQKIETMRLKNMSPKEKIMISFEMYMSTLSLFNLPIKPGETAVDYGDRIDLCLLISKPFCMKKIAEIFTTVRYGNNIIPSEEEAEYVYNFKKHLEFKIRKEYGKLKFLIMRYVLGKI